MPDTAAIPRSHVLYDSPGCQPLPHMSRLANNAQETGLLLIDATVMESSVGILLKRPFAAVQSVLHVKDSSRPSLETTLGARQT
jgi:hypothetical protein